MEIRLINPDMPREFEDDASVITQILKNRNITETPDEFFELSWDDVQSPYDLDYIQEAAGRIHCAVFNGEKIAILVDADTDGLTSSAVLTNYLRRCDPNVDLVHVFHDGKKHGLSDTYVMKKLRDEVMPDLLIIPDASGTEQQYNALTELNINIVVLDHHEGTAHAPDERVIIVNNQDSKNYRNKKLSGAGVVWQCLRVLDDMLEHDWANCWLDIVATGLVADVMDLKERETRFLVQEGLKPSNVTNPVLLAYAATNSYSMGTTRYNPTKIGWNIGPLFNAVIRMGDATEFEFLFKALLEDAGEFMVESGKRGHKGELVPIVEEALRQATNAKSRQTRRQNKLVAMLEEYIQEHSLYNNQIILIKIDEFDKEERALSGVVANKLLDYYKRPVLLAYQNDKDKSFYAGSLRSPDDVPCFRGFKSQCEESGLFEWLAGHESAAGFGFKDQNFEAIVEYFNERYAGQSTEISYDVDYLFSADDPHLADVILALEDYTDWWGKGIEEPMIAIVNAKCTIHDISLMSSEKNPTLKFSLPSSVAAIKFHSSKAEFDSFCKRGDSLLDSNTANNFTLVGQASVNRWRDTVTPQVILKYYEHTGYSYEF